MNQSKNIYWDITDPQHTIITSKEKFKIFLGGIGSGKTAVGWMQSLKTAFEQPDSIGVIVTTTYPMLRDVIWREMDRWLPEQKVENFDETHKELRLTNGSIILFRSADNPRQIERLRGMSIAWFWIDEVTLMPKLVWDILVGRLRQPGMQYSGLLTGTPKMNWVYDLFVNPETRLDSEEYFVLKEIPTHSNTFLPPEYIRTLEEQYSGQFYEQEILGKFVSFEGLIYELGEGSIIDSPNYNFNRFVYGVDFGFKNPSAVVVVGEYQGKYYVVDEFYQRRVTDDELVDIIKQKQDIWGTGRIFCDPSAPASIEKMRREGLMAEKANNDVLGGIRQVRSLLDSERLFVCNNCQNLLNEFKTYMWSDNEKREEPIKLNDHAMDALRYGCMGAIGTSAMTVEGLADLLVSPGHWH